MSDDQPTRIGIYGGTFDPPHLAHLVVAERCREALSLDRVLFIPCGRPALKGSARADGAHRLAMVAAAIADRPEFDVSDLEIARPGVSYTADTLAALAAAQPGHEWWLLLGLDAVVDLPRWREPRRILELARLAVVPRPGVDVESVVAELPEWVRQRLTVVPMPGLALASREVRADLAAGRSVRYLLPDAVSAYIAKHRLYTDA